MIGISKKQYYRKSKNNNLIILEIYARGKPYCISESQSVYTLWRETTTSYLSWDNLLLYDKITYFNLIKHYWDHYSHFLLTVESHFVGSN